ncbi:MAG: leucine-rich repeat protein [Kiritimatiellae bacterium]|nr:leucine-rich repeat protein [Kiritimatiellia bacterium]
MKIRPVSAARKFASVLLPLLAMMSARIAWGGMAVDEKYIVSPAGGGGLGFSRYYEKDPQGRYYAAVNEWLGAVDAVIPETISYQKGDTGWVAAVTYLTYEACRNAAGMKSLVVPSSIVPNPSSTGDGYAFSGCVGLESVKLHCGFIGKGWFNGCTSLRTIDLSKIHSLGYYAFRGSGLREVSLHAGLSSSVRLSYRFADCGSLAKVELEEGLAGIGGYEFQNCTALKDITIPRSLSYLGTGAFMGCANLTNATILGCARSSNHDGIFANCRSLKTVNVGDGVTHLNSHMFKNCTSLETVTIGSGVGKLPVYLFSNCTSLKKVVFRGNAPSSVGSFAFENVPSDCTIYVKRGSTGWGVDIPGTWHGRSIKYIGGSSPAPSGAFTVSFNANGGNASTTRLSVSKSASIGSLPNAARKGYRFKGWFTKKIGGSKIKPTTKVVKNVTYYAQWTANKYKIKFSPNGGKGRMNTVSASYGKTRALPSNKFKRSGYRFMGWSFTMYSRPAYKNKAKVKNLTDRNGGVVTLYAAWARKSSKMALSSVAKQSGAAAAVKAAKLAFASETKKLAKTPKKGTVGDELSLKIRLSASSSDVRFSAKSLPKGLSISKKSGRISGVPMKPGSFTSKVTAKDSAGNTISQKVKFKIVVPSHVKGTFYGTAMPDGKNKSYIQFTIGSAGNVSGKVNYKGEWKEFKSSLRFGLCTCCDEFLRTTFTPKVSLGSKTFKPGMITVQRAVKGGLACVYADDLDGKLFAQKKSDLVKSGKKFESLLGADYLFTRDDVDSGLTKGNDKLVVKLGDNDSVTVAGTINGKKISAFKWALLFFHGEPSADGGETIYLSAEVCEPSLKYYRRIVFRVYVTPDGEVGDPATSFQQ